MPSLPSKSPASAAAFTAEAKARAFVMFELDELSAEEVVAAVPETLNPNNLYQIYSRVRLALAREACRPNSYMVQLRSA